MDAGLNIFKHIKCPAGDKCTSVRCLFFHEDNEVAPAATSLPGGVTHPGRDETRNEETDTTHSPFSDQSGPRKRLKTGEEEYDPSSPALTLSQLGEPASAASASTSVSAVFLGAASTAAPKITAAEVMTTSVGTKTGTKPVNPFAVGGGGGVSKTKKVSSQDGAPSPKPSSRVMSQRAEITPPPLKRKHPSSSPMATGSCAAKEGANPLGKQSSPAVPAPAAGTPKPERAPEGLNPRYMTSNPAKFEVRLKLVKMLHEQYTRLNKELNKKPKDDDARKYILPDQELIWMALDEEESAARDRPIGYSNILKARVLALKKFTVADWIKERVEVEKKAADARLVKEAVGQGSRSDKPIVIDTGLTPEQEVLVLKAKLLTPIGELSQFGYVPAVPAEADIVKAREAEETSQGWEVCDRCARRFQVFPGRREEDGALTSGGPCTHHPGKAYIPNRQATGDRSVPERQYRCCGETVGQSTGCTTKETHVFRFSDPKRLGSVWNFAETPENPNAPRDRAVCFDCEMGYTAKGFELIRLTATSWPGGEELVDVLVRPIGEVLDLNSRYSGVWPEDIHNSRPFSMAEMKAGEKEQPHPPPRKNGERKRLQMVSSPLVARDLLFSLISRDTPLIGHGLENDLNCMRIVHPTVVDTVLLFPHRRRLPIRNSLKMLMSTLLNRSIQAEVEEGDESGRLQGHDSAEDARAAGELVRWKIKGTWEAMRRDGWRIADGRLVPPFGVGAGGK